jgi:lysophospholipase L1-like esterase
MFTRALLILISLAMCGFNAPESLRVFIAGDSTMADKPVIDNPEHGWGQMIPMFFSRNVTFFNHAKNGRSTRSFLLEGRWDALLRKVRPGDLVLIQFGHNDSKAEDTSRYAAPFGEYTKNLTRFVKDVRDRSGIPVLLTPVNRRNFDSTGTFVDKHGDYPAAVRAVAKNEKAAMIDLHAKSKKLFEQLGDIRSRELFLVSVKPNVYRALPNGKTDNTHFTRQGAVVIAGLVAEGMKELNLPAARYLRLEKETMPITSGIVVGLDQFYNNEWKKLNDSVSIRYHYTWDDTMDSGFSELGKLFDRNGADLDTLNSAPTDSSLARFSIYIIVDPDTPKETAQPNTLQIPAIDAIERWVKNGGTLVLMANDKGNSEFQQFNQLAARFGIRFNEDMHQDVKNNQYDSAKISHFPMRPLFAGLDFMFIKQFCSITVTAPAKEVLRSRGAVVMAEASLGKGKVFAVGDPWLYNEYIDNRRLPAGYENYPAAENVVRWLLRLGSNVR